MVNLVWLYVLYKGKACNYSKYKSIKYNQETDETEPSEYLKVRSYDIVPQIFEGI